ncbi:hypothetical protein EMIHUDRAFT_222243 [Emiliania huxleyi CCMP1516]|uniref:Uncharacterized protein n=2 Tax=Emiliania huxleyi TaxID=2903 RepID=A0A0D3KYN0_EMIH1|nr:hypothetical protein EMIHUDRAFT_222243 [Emiliania huxleyi CCMP1516]EOD40865.1 hypothetical protein EMIHUDRAFT_222243 [Emiliania huxleyi CCMP1516]|eukprot:XP_005793294.1 hypothetical protein EMIHUDRAFT_222243 [Emiliania huxleyi CCMP1516]
MISANEARSLSDMRRVALASAALAFCLPAKWVAGASAAVACLTAATGRRLGASAPLGVVAIVASATRLDSTLSQELPHALARVMAHATRSNARLASRKCDRPRLAAERGKDEKKSNTETIEDKKGRFSSQTLSAESSYGNVR